MQVLQPRYLSKLVWDFILCPARAWQSNKFDWCCRLRNLHSRNVRRPAGHVGMPAMWERNCLDHEPRTAQQRKQVGGGGPCSEGTNCPGSNQLELLPGFFSSTENPGSVFRCYGDESRCSGGPPGSCVSGRDNRSLACGACLEGLRAAGASCEECGDGDYILSVLTGLVILLGTGCLHFMLLRQDKEHYIQTQTQAGLLNASVFASQLVVCLQLLA